MRDGGDARVGDTQACSGQLHDLNAVVAYRSSGSGATTCSTPAVPKASQPGVSPSDAAAPVVQISASNGDALLLYDVPVGPALMWGEAGEGLQHFDGLAGRSCSSEVYSPTLGFGARVLLTSPGDLPCSCRGTKPPCSGEKGIIVEKWTAS